MLLTGTLPCGQAELSLAGASGRRPAHSRRRCGLERPDGIEIGGITNFAIRRRALAVKIYSAAQVSGSPVE